MYIEDITEVRADVPKLEYEEVMDAAIGLIAHFQVHKSVIREFFEKANTLLNVIDNNDLRTDEPLPF